MIYIVFINRTPMNAKYSSSRRRANSAFTLFEIMAVMVIISIMLGVTFSSVTSLTTGREMNAAVETVSRSMVTARQLSMTRGLPVALAISPAKTSSADTTRQALLILEGIRQANGTIAWTATTPWKVLPQVITTKVFERSANSPTFYDQSTSGGGNGNDQEETGVVGTLHGELPIKLNGESISSYSYIIFQPDGTVEAPEDGPSLSLSRDGKNTYDYLVLVQKNSGRSKVISQ